MTGTSTHAGHRFAGTVALLSSLRYRPFAWLWVGQTISQAGDVIYQIALVWWVLRVTGSAAASGGVLICSFVPMLLFLLFGGAAVDRFPRLILMLASDAARGGIVSCVALLAATHHLAVWHLYLAATGFGLAAAFFRPASAAVISELVPEDRLLSANSLNSFGQQVVGLAGPAVGAAIVSTWGPPTAMALNGLSFFISAICLLALVRAPGLRRHPPRREGMLQDIRAGLTAVSSARWLWMTILVASLVNIAESGPRNLVLPYLVHQSLGAGVGVLGLLYSVFAIGAMGAALWVGARRALRRRGPMPYAAWGISGLLMTCLALPLGLMGAALAVAGWGFMVEVVGLMWTSILQKEVPSDLLGRVTSIDFLGSFGLIPFGYALAGVASDAIGPAAVFALGGVATAILGGLGLLEPAIRRLN